MRARIGLRTGLLLGMLALVACGPIGANQPPNATPPATAPSPSAPPSPVSSPDVDPRAQAAVDAAVRDAATQAGVAATDLTVERVQATEWPDASLGCPRPGAMYAQVVTPGFRIVIGGGGKRFEYHSDERGRVVLCSQS